MTNFKPAAIRRLGLGALATLFAALIPTAPVWASCADEAVVQALIAGVANKAANAALQKAWTQIVPNKIPAILSGQVCPRIDKAFSGLGTQCVPGRDAWIHPGAAPTIATIQSSDVCITAPNPKAFQATINLSFTWAPPENDLGATGTDAQIYFQRRPLGVNASSNSLSGNGSGTITVAGIFPNQLQTTGAHIDHALAAVDMQVHFLVIGKGELSFQTDVSGMLQTGIDGAFNLLGPKVAQNIPAQVTTSTQACLANHQIFSMNGCQTCPAGFGPNSAGLKCIVTSCPFGSQANSDQSACVPVCTEAGTQLHQFSCLSSPGSTVQLLTCKSPADYSTLTHGLNMTCPNGKSPTCSYGTPLASVNGVPLVGPVSSACSACPLGFHAPQGGTCMKCPGNQVWSIGAQKCVAPSKSCLPGTPGCQNNGFGG